MSITSKTYTGANNMFDLIGIGIGPFNLGLAALSEDVEGINALFLEQKPRFQWHAGLLMEETTLQVPFFADVVTMADPTSRFSFLNYLHEHERLYKFYFLERFHIPRREYNHYCQWVAEQLSSCCFGQQVTEIKWKNEPYGEGYFEVEAKDIHSGKTEYYQARHLALGVGNVPYLPDCFSSHSSDDVFHSAEFLYRKERCSRAKSITVIGSGQSAGEVFLDLLREQQVYGYRLDWFTRSKGFFPMEYSKLGLEHFSPEYTRYFYQLPQDKKDRIIPKQDLLYKGISAKTISDIYDVLYERSVGGEKPPVRMMAMTEVSEVQRLHTEEGDAAYRLSCMQWEQEQVFSHDSDVVIAATGYHRMVPGCLASLHSLIHWDEYGRYIVQDNYQLKLTEDIPNKIFVQNGEMHTHGVGAPDLGLGAYRNSVIINHLANREAYPVRSRNVFTQFGIG
ncbi:lysine N(6)-hydroxylase/L-ornithine N(5)-oxygenase family protein [Paenibacillus alkaliterrae]|uniref:lysine N(6)-hydroxylase/L-ornithine N(5)-oxygenase family protein n=1 Tax=Paenibacillus alkaliterrae TaxID=320909 RepID=UPI001F4014BA|nr:lysine N(6)-hydroxylase/L-ornithine N(5)-oxygenase family protein [Paenibacillus alkaliterrae]MCF2938676.1 lysine N(6)-hydroxylase/L-ornithine N(5)-oxygenase family protein [Paenibacillus alkaliterrae]